MVSLASIFFSHDCAPVQDSKAQVTAIHLIIGTLQRMNIFGVENRDTLTHKATGVIKVLFVKQLTFRASRLSILTTLPVFSIQQSF